jgi:5'-3' exonuclease
MKNKVFVIGIIMLNNVIKHSNMGIRELSKFIEPCGEIVHYNKFQMKYVAVDAFQKIYKYCNSRDEKISEQSGEYNNHLRAIINCVSQLIKHKIIPIFVFDGASIAIKAQFKQKKNIETQIREDKIANTKNIQNEQIHKKNTFKISPKQIKECETLINYFGLQFIRAPFEADSQCAAMTFKKVESVLTDDTDIMTFGSKSMLKMMQLQFVDTVRKLFNEFLATKPNVTEMYSISDMINVVDKNYSLLIKNKINIEKKYCFDTIKEFSSYDSINFAIEYEKTNILEFLKSKANAILEKNGSKLIDNFTQSNFIDMCILFGSDYQQRICNATTEKIFNMYIMSGFDVVSCVKYVNANFPVKLEDDYLQVFKDIKEYYENATVIEPTTINYQIYRPDENMLFKYMREFKFPHSHIINVINSYKKSFTTLHNISRTGIKDPNV